MGGCPFHSDDGASDPEDGGDATPAGDGDSSGGPPAGVDRRSFLKSALLIGGVGALESAMGLFDGSAGAVAAATTDDPVTVAERANRQHAWDAYEQYDPTRETSIPPGRHLLLHLDYLGDGRPTEADRRAATAAFRELEATFDWRDEGLLFTVGYSAAYFDRYAESLPLGLDPDSGFAKPGLLRPETLIDTPGVTLPHEDPVADSYDAVVHLASDHEEVLLAAEALLWGETVDVGGETRSLDADLSGVFSKPTDYPARRVGFTGHDNLEAEGGEDDPEGVYPSDIPDEDAEGDHPAAKLSMGFNDLFRNSVPRETNATMVEEQRLVEPKPPGVFAQGTVAHVSKLDIDLDSWYDYDTQGRRERMFSPHHDADNTGVVGEELGNSNAPGDRPMRDVSSDDRDVAEATEADAESEGVVGHVQKTARARFDLNERLTDALPEDDPLRQEVEATESGTDYDTLPGHDGPQEAEQVILRRDVDTVEQNRPGNLFVALMRFNPYMAYMRQAMNGVAFDSKAFGLTGDARIQHDDIRDEVTPDANGIANFLETTRRGNYVVPPLTLRGLPPARAARPPLLVEPGTGGVPSVDGTDETIEVALGAGDAAVSEAALSTAAGAWRDDAVGLDGLRGLVEDWRDEGPTLPDGYERDPATDQPREYGGPTDVDPATARIGSWRAVNTGRGATPSDHTHRDVDGDGVDELVCTVPVDEMGVTPETRYLRLYAETEAGFPVFATAPINRTDSARALRRRLATDS